MPVCTCEIEGRKRCQEHGKPHVAKWQRACILADEGYPPKEIAKMLGMSRRSVSTSLSQARKAGYEIPRFNGQGGFLKRPPLPRRVNH